MKALKALVIGMGALVVIGLGLVGFGIYRNGHPTVAAGPDPVKANPRLSAFARTDQFALEVAPPPGTRLEQMQAAGDLIILRFAGAGGDRLTIIDPLAGRITGTVAILPAKP